MNRMEGRILSRPKRFLFIVTELNTILDVPDDCPRRVESVDVMPALAMLTLFDVVLEVADERNLRCSRGGMTRLTATLQRD